MLRESAADGLAFAPGAAYDYSNTNYLLLALIAERLTGRAYHELLRDRILDPLGLADTFVEGYEDLPYALVAGSNRDRTGAIDAVEAFTHPSVTSASR